MFGKYVSMLYFCLIGSHESILVLTKLVFRRKRQKISPPQINKLGIYKIATVRPVCYSTAYYIKNKNTFYISYNSQSGSSVIIEKHLPRHQCSILAKNGTENKYPRAGTSQVATTLNQHSYLGLKSSAQIQQVIQPILPSTTITREADSL